MTESSQWLPEEGERDYRGAQEVLGVMGKFAVFTEVKVSQVQVSNSAVYVSFIVSYTSLRSCLCVCISSLHGNRHSLLFSSLTPQHRSPSTATSQGSDVRNGSAKSPASKLAFLFDFSKIRKPEVCIYKAPGKRAHGCSGKHCCVSAAYVMGVLLFAWV